MKIKKRYLLSALFGVLFGAAGFPISTLSGFAICVFTSVTICFIATVLDVSKAHKNEQAAASRLLAKLRGRGE